MNSVLTNIIEIIDVEQIEANLFRGQCHPSEHVFGGQVLAQQLQRLIGQAGASTALSAFLFLRPGNSTKPILFSRSNTKRQIIFNSQGNCHSGWQSYFHFVLFLAKSGNRLNTFSTASRLASDALRGDLETYKALSQEQNEFARFAFRFEAIDSRSVEDFNCSRRKPPTLQEYLAARPIALTTNLGSIWVYWLTCRIWIYVDLHVASRAGKTAGWHTGRKPRPLNLVSQTFQSGRLAFVSKESPHAGGARGFVRVSSSLGMVIW